MNTVPGWRRHSQISQEGDDHQRDLGQHQPPQQIKKGLVMQYEPPRCQFFIDTNTIYINFSCMKAMCVYVIHLGPKMLD